MQLGEAKQAFELALSSAIADFKIRNEGSYLGILWYLLNPLLTFFLLFLIFSSRFGTGIESYPAYLLLGIVVFNFFQSSTSESTRAILGSSSQIKSINYPREAIILSIIIRTIFSHFFEIMVFVLLLIIMKSSLTGILLYPLILFFLCLFALGVSFLLSALSTAFLDMGNVWAFFSRLLWFATPIFYSANEHPALSYLNLFNPMYYFITISRDVIIYSRIPDIWLLSGAFLYSAVFLATGIFAFNNLKKKFAEMV